MRELSLKLHRIFYFFYFSMLHSTLSLFSFCFHIRWMFECLLVLFVWFYDIFRSSCMVGCDASGSCLKRQIKRVSYNFFQLLISSCHIVIHTFFIFHFNLIRLQQQAMRKFYRMYCILLLNVVMDIWHERMKMK